MAKGKQLPASQIDQHLGQRITQARSAAELSLEATAKSAGVTAEQLAAMEAGSIRITSLTLARLAREFDIKLGWFFEGLPGQDLFEAKGRGETSV